MSADLSPFVPRLIVDWVASAPEATHRRVPGTLVFTDLTGFTAMSERLGALGKVGAEELTDHLDTTFTELLTVAGRFGGSLLKFGGDALLLFFWGDGHEARAGRAAVEMQDTLERIGLIDTSAGDVRLRMTVGAHAGDFDFFLVGSTHRELLICGEGATETVRIEAGAEPGEVRVSKQLAARLDPSVLDEPTDDGARLAGTPLAEVVPIVTPTWPDGTSATPFVPSLLREQLASGVELTEHRQMVIGFLHLSNVDDLLATVGPRDTALHLQALVAHVQTAFDAHGVAFVSTDIYEGGPKIICATGAVRTFENDDERLLRALREIGDYPSAIDVRIGVNRGHGFCGYVGPSFRRTFVTIGDVVNTAARVMSKAQPGEILSTREALDRSDTVFETEELPPFAAKGKAEPLVAYRVGEATGSRDERTHRDLPLVGRDAELEILEGHVAKLRDGRGGVIEIVGDVGMGKSRLAAELLAGAPGLASAEQRCGRYAASTPFFPFRPLFAGLVGGSDPDALVAAVRARAPHLEDRVPLLGMMLGLELDLPPEIENLDAAAFRNALHEAVGRFLDAMVDEPTIWLIEDAHWLDGASAELIAFLAQRTDPGRLLVCVTRRPDGDAIASERSLLLEPLTEAAAVELLRRSSDAELMDAELKRVIERSHGNPHFLIELGRVVSSPGGLDHLPDSLEAILAARIDELPPGDRLALRQLAVLGNRFDRTVAEEVVVDVRRANLDEFVDRTGDEWRFVHTLVRDTAYEGLSYRERREIHDRTGSVIESRVDDPHRLCELLSLHFHSAENHPKSLHYSKDAAEKARRSFAFIECAHFFERTVHAARVLEDDLELGDALTGLGHAELDQGLYTQAEQHYQESLEIKRRLGNEQGVAAQLNGLGLVARQQGDYERAAGYFRESLSILEGLPNAQTMGAVLTNLGTVAWFQGNYDDAKRWFEAALERAREREDLDGIASSLDTLGTVAFALGDLSTARERYEESLEMRRQIGDKPGVAIGLRNLGNVAHQQGRVDEARSAWEDALALHRELGDRRGVTSVLMNLGTSAYTSRDYDLARERYEEAVQLARALGDPGAVAQSLHNLGEVALVTGDLELARISCEEALAIRRQLGNPRGLAESLTTLGSIAAELGDQDGASALQAEALGLLAGSGNSLGLADCLEAVALRCAAEGNPTVAVVLLGACQALHDAAESVPAPSDRRDRAVRALRDALGVDAFERGFEDGRTGAADRAVELARTFLEGRTSEAAV